MLRSFSFLAALSSFSRFLNVVLKVLIASWLPTRIKSSFCASIPRMSRTLRSAASTSRRRDWIGGLPLILSRLSTIFPRTSMSTPTNTPLYPQAMYPGPGTLSQSSPGHGRRQYCQRLKIPCTNSCFCVRVPVELSTPTAFLLEAGPAPLRSYCRDLLFDSVTASTTARFFSLLFLSLFTVVSFLTVFMMSARVISVSLSSLTSACWGKPARQSLPTSPILSPPSSSA
mmetsp:Transcript_13998/g.25017  ORF Transcript_13998/g.25017 Transcript_13998/m.25017 type:complete len:228 (-) Transcript_13998:133-816(-)